MTGIICTIGPSCSSVTVLKELAAAGMEIARLNFSHGTHKEHAEYIENIRQVNLIHKCNIKIMQDLEGYRLRLGKLPQKILLTQGRIVELFKAKESYLRSDTEIPVDFEGDCRMLFKGTEIFIDDGNILLKVLFCRKNKITAKVIIPGVIRSNNGINIPDMEFTTKNMITEKDMHDINFGIEHKIDLLAQSFVRDKNDIIQIQKILTENKFKCTVIAKIENRDGINNLDGIIEKSDGVMIARGDLGVSIPIYEVPVVQKQIIEKCKKAKKISITATQMLESMRYNHRPSRAEVSDVANAVLDGSRYVMLSAETAVGKFPVESVKMMKQIIDHTSAFRKNPREGS
ncbi:pyruvate kinase [Candidatus Cloacimonadota bacterium]